MVWVQTQVEATIFFQFFLPTPPTDLCKFLFFIFANQTPFINTKLAQVGGTLSESYKYKILWSETMVNVTNFAIPSLKVKNSFWSVHLYIIKYQNPNQKFVRIHFVFSSRFWHLCLVKYGLPLISVFYCLDVNKDSRKLDCFCMLVCPIKFFVI